MKAKPAQTHGTHELDLEDDFINDAWAARCSCGRRFRWRHSEADAIEEWEQHCDAVFMEATGG